MSCVATNAVGRMEDERSCVFHVILARRPTPPANCSVIEDPEEGRPRMGLRCHPGFGGGLDQVITNISHSGCLPVSAYESAVQQPKNDKNCSFFH